MARAVEGVEKAVNQGAQIVCLQELFRTYYFPQTRVRSSFGLAEPVPGPTTDVFSRLARRSGVVIVVPVFERKSARVYHNAAVVIDADGGIAGIYRKMHLPSDPSFYEDYYFTPGSRASSSFQTRYGKLAVLICWDQWFPEPARLAAVSGASILFYPTAIGWRARQRGRSRFEEREAWEMVQRSHAIANGIFVAAVNRVGREGALRFWGGSFVAGPLGRVVACAGGDRGEVLVARLDLSEIARVREDWPFLRKRRIPLRYEPNG